MSSKAVRIQSAMGLVSHTCAAVKQVLGCLWSMAQGDGRGEAQLGLPVTQCCGHVGIHVPQVHDWAGLLHQPTTSRYWTFTTTPAAFLGLACCHHATHILQRTMHGQS